MNREPFRCKQKCLYYINITSFYCRPTKRRGAFSGAGQGFNLTVIYTDEFIGVACQSRESTPRIH